jgi:hypothetical protein
MKPFAIVLIRGGKVMREMVGVNQPMYNVSIFRNVTMNPLYN